MTVPESAGLKVGHAAVNGADENEGLDEALRLYAAGL
jgi:hypothetical protein